MKVKLTRETPTSVLLELDKIDAPPPVDEPHRCSCGHEHIVRKPGIPDGIMYITLRTPWGREFGETAHVDEQPIRKTIEVGSGDGGEWQVCVRPFHEHRKLAEWSGDLTRA